MERKGGKGRAGQGRLPDCLGGLSRVGISSRSTRPWNGQPPSYSNNSFIVTREAIQVLRNFTDAMGWGYMDQIRLTLQKFMLQRLIALQWDGGGIGGCQISRKTRYVIL